MDLKQIIQEQAAPILANIGELSEEKREGVLGSLVDSVLNTVQKNVVSSDGLSSVQDLFSENADLSANPLVQKIQSFFTQDAIQRLGIDNVLVQKIAALVPTIISSITSNLGDSKLDLGSIISSLGKGGSSSAKGGGLLRILKDIGLKLLAAFLSKKK